MQDSDTAHMWNLSNTVYNLRMNLKTVVVIIENLSHSIAFKLLVCNSTQNHISYLSAALDLNLASDLLPDGEHGEKMSLQA